MIAVGRYVPNWLRREVAKINLERDLEERKKQEQRRAEFLKEHGPLYVIKFGENEYLEIAHYKEGKEEVMNDAVFHVIENFELYWGKRLLQALSIIHKLAYIEPDVDEE